MKRRVNGGGKGEGESKDRGFTSLSTQGMDNPAIRDCSVSYHGKHRCLSWFVCESTVNQTIK